MFARSKISFRRQSFRPSFFHFCSGDLKKRAHELAKYGNRGIFFYRCAHIIKSSYIERVTSRSVIENYIVGWCFTLPFAHEVTSFVLELIA